MGQTEGEQVESDAANYCFKGRPWGTGHIFSLENWILLLDLTFMIIVKLPQFSNFEGEYM